MTPPNAATTGRTAARRSASAPEVISRRISSPTIRKNTASNPSENQSPTLMESGLPGGPMPNGASMNARYHGASGVFVASRAASAARIRTRPPEAGRLANTRAERSSLWATGRSRVSSMEWKSHAPS